MLLGLAAAQFHTDEDVGRDAGTRLAVVELGDGARPQHLHEAPVGAGLLRDRDGQQGFAPFADLGALGDVAQAVEVEVGAGIDGNQGAAFEPALGGIALQPGQRHAAGGLRHRAGPVEDVLHGGADLVRRDGDDLVEAFPADAKGFDAGLAHRDAVGEEAHAIEHHALAGRDRGLHGGGVVGLDADDLHVGPQELDKSRDAGSETAAADGNEDRLDRPGVLLQDLHPDRALARDDVRIVIGRHIGEAALLAERLGMLGGLVEIVADDDGIAAACPHARHLDARCRARHHDGGDDAELLAREGDALRVVAGRGRDDAALQRLARQARHLVVGAADLEGEDRLQVLALQQHAIVQPPGEGGQGIERRPDRDVVDPRVEDAAGVVGEVDGVGRRLRPGHVEVHGRTGRVVGRLIVCVVRSKRARCNPRGSHSRLDPGCRGPSFS